MSKPESFNGTVIDTKIELDRFLREFALDVPHDAPIPPNADVLCCGEHLASLASWCGAGPYLRPMRNYGGLASVVPYWWAHTTTRLLPLHGFVTRVAPIPDLKDSPLPESVRYGVVLVTKPEWHSGLDQRWRQEHPDFREVLLRAGDEPMFRDGLLATLNLLLVGAPPNLNETSFEREEAPGVWVPTRRSDAKNADGSADPVRSTTPGKRIWQTLLRELGEAR